jgi:hypothetical protein
MLFELLELIMRRFLISIQFHVLLRTMVKLAEAFTSGKLNPESDDTLPLENVVDRCSSWFMGNHYSKSLQVKLVFRGHTAKQVYNVQESFKVDAIVVDKNTNTSVHPWRKM